MNKRSGFKVMTGLIGMVKPLMGYMLLAILLGFAGHLCAAFITIFGGIAVLNVIGMETAFSCPDHLHIYRNFRSGKSSRPVWRTDMQSLYSV